ncbi:MAG TPA: SET domain-containing protein-lysine N-methyltransferase [Thermoanaerobaculia bacterium]|nr:SET domain-containing protein-lysine N-methyltransferase [Thermoanaerobaculia bacterium]
MPRRPAEPPYEVRTSRIQGRGLFATRRIRKGRRIIEYTGERITWEEASVRYDDDAMVRHHTFLFAVDANTVIDAVRYASEARWINHSCAPKCRAVLEDRRIFIEAICNIQPGVELTYDYHCERADRYRKEWKKLYACHCGAPNCRGTLLKRIRPG